MSKSTFITLNDNGSPMRMNVNHIVSVRTEKVLNGDGTTRTGTVISPSTGIPIRISDSYEDVMQLLYRSEYGWD